MAREYSIVPRDENVNTFLQQAKYMDLNPYTKTAITLDGQMQQILQAPDMSEHIKVKKYLDTLNNYLLYKEKAFTPINFNTTPLESKKIANGTDGDGNHGANDDDDDDAAVNKITNFIRGKTQNLRARQLMQHIKKYKGTLLDYDADGTNLVIDGKPIQGGTHLTDILNDLVNSGLNARNSGPAGTSELLKLLKRTGVPQLLIRNLTRKQELNDPLLISTTKRIKRTTSLNRDPKMAPLIKSVLKTPEPHVSGMQTRGRTLTRSARVKPYSRKIAKKINWEV